MIAMKVYVLQTGDYEQRGIHSIHSTRADAEAIDARVRRTHRDKDSSPDIDEWELGQELCDTCGYDEDLHTRRPEIFDHAFKAYRSAPKPWPMTTTGSPDMRHSPSGLQGRPMIIRTLALLAFAVPAFAQTVTSDANNNTKVGSFALFSNISGTNNTACGSGALSTNMGGEENTGCGVASSGMNAYGNANTSFGAYALQSNTVSNNNAFGHSALSSNTIGTNNVAVGNFTSYYAVHANGNTAVGNYALYKATGDNNIGIGLNGGTNLTGSGNIAIGHVGLPTDINTTRIGTNQTAAYVAGITGKKLTGSLVVVTTTGQLGVAATDPIAALQAQVTAQAALIKTLQAQVAALLLKR